MFMRHPKNFKFLFFRKRSQALSLPRLTRRGDKGGALEVMLRRQPITRRFRLRLDHGESFLVY